MQKIKFRVSAANTTVGYELCSKGTWKYKEVGGTYRYGTFGGKDYKRWQFTGLLDRHGKEIYEGDIVRWISWLFTADGDCLRTTKWAKVVFNASQFELVGRNDTVPLKSAYESSVVYESTHDRAFEVIGNIHENPELTQTAPTDKDGSIRTQDLSRASTEPEARKDQT